ncbi:MAG: hypothetical protein VB050_15400 [Geobacteraceae bacterium]|nr:hypothetical protein [Geobacteraceae bacterium]
MKNVTPPTGDFMQLFRDLVSRKGTGTVRTLLEGMSATIQQRYSEYHDHRTRPEQISSPNRTTAQYEALKSCYVNSRKFKAELLATLHPGSDVRLPRCPYCQLHPATRWDHFLPSKKYPDFFVYPPNLVRSCSVCNDDIKKDQHVAPTRKTVHPYFDPLSNHQYLKCTVRIIDNRINIKFNISTDNQSPNYSTYVAAVVGKHFKTFGLARKFEAEACEKLGALLVTVTGLARTDRLCPSARQITSIIEEYIRDLRRRGEGPNNWEIVFWSAITEAGGITDFLRIKLLEQGIVD